MATETEVVVTEVTPEFHERALKAFMLKLGALLADVTGSAMTLPPPLVLMEDDLDATADISLTISVSEEGRFTFTLGGRPAVAETPTIAGPAGGIWHPRSPGENG